MSIRISRVKNIDREKNVIIHSGVDESFFPLFKEYYLKANRGFIDMVVHREEDDTVAFHFKKDFDLNNLEFNEFFISDTGVLSLVINDLDETVPTSWDEVIEIVCRKNFPPAIKEIMGEELIGIVSIPLLRGFETIKCSETGLIQPKCLAHREELYDTPYDESGEEYYFINPTAASGYKGDLYPKDFSYFYCDSCEREICEQNPTNGYETNYSSIGCDVMCKKCFKEFLLENGIVRDLIYAAVPGAFFGEDVLIEEGWIKKSTHFVDASNLEYMLKVLHTMLDSGIKTIVNYESVAYGNMEGTISIWSKGE